MNIEELEDLIAYNLSYGISKKETFEGLKKDIQNKEIINFFINNI